MNRVLSPHLQILPPAQRRLWPELKALRELGFVLYGGTAIGLRLGHRPSVDFDFFSDVPLDRPALSAALPWLAGATALQEEPNALTVNVPSRDPGESPVKLSLFGTIGFGRVGDPALTDDGVLQIASLDDLMATKVKVVLQRAEARDYRDIAAMIAAGVSLSQGLASARLMFGPSFQPSASLKALVYFDDGDLSTLNAADRTALIQAASSVRELPQVALLSRSLACTGAG